MNTKKAGLLSGATLVGIGVLAARWPGSKLHEHCKRMQAEGCGHGVGTGEEPAEPKCSPKVGCAGPMDAEEVE